MGPRESKGSKVMSYIGATEGYTRHSRCGDEIQKQKFYVFKW